MEVATPLGSRYPQPPTFSLKKLKAAIPPHCFKPSLFWSFYYTIVDLTLVLVLMYAATYIPSFPRWLGFFLWPLYWYAAGCVMTGVWVIAHECGHQSFSTSETINDTVGLILHSLLLVPYYSWKISHRKHHMNTGSMENDEVFVPSTRSSLSAETVDSPLRDFIYTVLMLLLGWPAYLTLNKTGPSKYKQSPKAKRNHFNPDCPIFTVEERKLIIISDIALCVVVVGMILFSWFYSFTSFITYYFIPYLIVNYHLVLITYLQHTDEYIPHYRAQQWNWLRGALATVDRDFSYFGKFKILNHVFHHISDTHVCHHIFSRIPHYYAEEATKHLIPVLSDYYLKDNRTIFKALWHVRRNCHFVEDEGDVLYSKSLKDTVLSATTGEVVKQKIM
eukprot:TRINITY_DN3101_c0_g1_i1.p1 TRINITY_DN3101_c0_g1~~TRINITY_DN3101_c0_g1_i1.p1  ORF type:complete len:390 (-),score=39.23 TRINITY_DN3101_c0_g1_i1:60-1229(-)